MEELKENVRRLAAKLLELEQELADHATKDDVTHAMSEIVGTVNEHIGTLRGDIQSIMATIAEHTGSGKP